MDVTGIDKRFLDKNETALSERIKALQGEALEKYKEITGKASIHSFHAMIGSNNNVFVDSVRTAFLDPNDFVSQWLQGLARRAQERELEGKLRPGKYRKIGREYFLLLALKDELLTEYITLFLTRNFYRNFKERVRQKPEESLWSIWFGSGNLVWGLLISPEMRIDEWVNDKSEMRRTDFNYWTVRHVMETGFIDPESEEPIKFARNKDFGNFYRSVLKRLSNSKYEKEISDRYLEYLNKSEAPMEEPFLIPELRFAGKDTKHKYRLDFTVLNPYTMKMTGFEISPSSTHMKVPKITGVKKYEIDENLSKQWQKEVNKRNEYFSSYGITTVTFADDDLKDIDHCFSIIEKYLSERSGEKVSVSTSLSDVRGLADELSL